MGSRCGSGDQGRCHSDSHDGKVECQVPIRLDRILGNFGRAVEGKQPGDLYILRVRGVYSTVRSVEGMRWWCERTRTIAPGGKLKDDTAPCTES